ELAQKINAVILDKTGTITEGKPVVNNLTWFSSFDKLRMTNSAAENKINNFESILYSIEEQSEHPLAEAIVNYLIECHSDEGGISNDDRFLTTQSSVRNDKVPNSPASTTLASTTLSHRIQIENESGKGIRGIYENENYFVGNPKFIQEQNLKFNDEIQNWMNSELNLARTVILFSNSKEVLAGISVSDSIKNSSKKAIQDLKNAGIEVYMQTGDNESTAKS